MSGEIISGDSYLRLGRVGRAHGLRGHFVLQDRSSPLEYDLTSKELLLKLNNGVTRTIAVTDQRPKAQQDILSLDGYPDRTAIEGLRGSEVFVSRKNLPILEDDEYYWQDLMGARVVDSEDQFVGSIQHVSNYGASDILEVCHPERGVLCVPLVEAYVDMETVGEGAQDTPIALAVGIDTFGDCWEPVS